MRTFLICLVGALFTAIAAQATPGDQATFDTAVAAYDAGRYEEAYAIFSKLADNEDVAAMRNVGLMLRRGQGVERNLKKALKWYREAAEAGLATAQADLGNMLLDGEAGKPDEEEGVRWLTFAAQAGHAGAQFRLAQLYEKGEVVSQDLELAKKLYAAAAEHGHKGAAAKLAALEPPQAVATASPSAAPADAAPASITPAETPGATTTPNETPATAPAESKLPSQSSTQASIAAHFSGPVVMMDPIPDKITRESEKTAKPIMVSQQPPSLRMAAEGSPAAPQPAATLAPQVAPAPTPEPTPVATAPDGQSSAPAQGTMHKTFFGPRSPLVP